MLPKTLRITVQIQTVFRDPKGKRAFLLLVPRSRVGFSHHEREREKPRLPKRNTPLLVAIRNVLLIFDPKKEAGSVLLENWRRSRNGRSQL